jgi:hypothetical protein
MIRKKLITIIAATTMMAVIQTAQASLTLAQFAAGGTLSIDDKTFTGSTYTESGLTSFDPNLIIVSVSQSGGIDYLTWSGNMSLTTGSAGLTTADLKLTYIVSASHGTINGIDQAFVGSSVNGFLTVDESVNTGGFAGTLVAYSHLEIGDFTDPPAEGFDVLPIIPPQTLLYVTKDMAFATIGPGLTTVSSVTQSFHQVPEPTTMVAGALLLLPFGASTLRFLRRRTA